MKFKKRISKLLVASLLSYGLSQGGFNNFNVVRGMEDANPNQNYAPPNNLEQRLTEDGLDGVTDDMRAAFNRISSRLMEIMAEDNVQADDPRVQELYDARGRWWGTRVRMGLGQKYENPITPIVGHKVAGYDEYGENDDNRVNARPLDGARRYCGALLNSRFVVSGPNGEELPGNMFAHNKELAPNGLAQGDVQLPCGHIMCVKCSHRIILSKCCENETWGYEKRGKLICPMDRAASDVPNLKTNNIPLGNSYWVSAGKSDLRATSPRTVYGAADPRTLWADRIRYNFIIPEEEQINDRGRFLRLPRERREQIEKERAERGADPDKLERERMANGHGREINMKDAMEAHRRRIEDMKKRAREMREKAEREERERVERERKAEEDRLAEEARRAEEARKEEEARILAEIERGARERLRQKKELKNDVKLMKKQEKEMTQL